MLAVRLQLGREGQREAKRGLLLAPMDAGSFMTKEDEGRLAREGELLVSKFRRARTPSGAVTRMDVDNLERLGL